MKFLWRIFSFAFLVNVLAMTAAAQTEPDAGEAQSEQESTGSDDNQSEEALSPQEELEQLEAERAQQEEAFEERRKALLEQIERDRIAELDEMERERFQLTAELVAAGKLPPEALAPVQPSPSTSDFRSWFLGGGLGTRINLSGERVVEVRPVTLADGTIVAQVQKSDEAEIRILLETHYTFGEEVSIYDRWVNHKDMKFGDFAYKVFDTASDLVACGFWAFLKPPPPPGAATGTQRLGCGPFVAVAFDVDATPEEFALGHMISFGDPRDGSNSRVFNLGYGIIIDPDSVVLDNAIFEPGTKTIRENYVDAVLNDDYSITQEEETLGFMLLFSTNF